MVDVEHGFPPFDGFDEALTTIRSEAQGVIEHLQGASALGGHTS